MPSDSQDRLSWGLGRMLRGQLCTGYVDTGISHLQFMNYLAHKSFVNDQLYKTSAVQHGIS